MSSLSNQIREKRDILRAEHGGLMSLSALSREIGMSRDAARKWGNENGLAVGGVGKRVKYDVDVLARIIVQRRGMC